MLTDMPLPDRNLYDGYYEGNVPGQNKMSRVFDSTAMQSTQNLLTEYNRIVSTTTSMVSIAPGEQIPEERQ